MTYRYPKTPDQCQGIGCSEKHTTVRDIGRGEVWKLCAGCASAFDIELADRLAHNEAEAAEHDRWLDRLYPKAS